VPEMDGLEATRAIRVLETHHKWRKIPIFAITAYAMPGDDDKCLNAGCDLYMSKPLNPQRLRMEIQSILSTPRTEKSKDYFS
jgi:CheY-like chemotaxis protein